MITAARKRWETRRLERAGHSPARISLALAVMSAAKRLGTNGIFAALMLGWGAVASYTVFLLAAH